MSLHSWLHNFRTALAPRRGQRQHARRGSKRAPTHRPGLEVLEDRCVPAFLAPVDYPVIASFAVDAEAADFNGDAILDLATVGQDGVVNVLLGNPDGTFQPALYNGANTSAASPSLAVGDFNEDGKLDLATNSNAYYGYSFDDVVVLLGNGDGTFVVQNLGTNLAAAAVATGDVNGDGHVDLVVASWGDPLSVLIGGGDGTFAPPTTYDGPYPEDFSSLELADFDADGNLDQAYPGVMALAVSLSNGDGSFAPPISTPVGYGPSFLIVRDFNADGRPDAALFHPGTWSGTSPYGVVTVLLNDGIWPPAAPLLTINDVVLTEGNSGTASATFTVTLSAPSDQPVTVAYATADGSATAGSDYQAASGTLTFAPGETTGTITVLVNGDRLGEGFFEYFFVNLNGATNAIIADGHGWGTIHEDEPRISIGDATLTEGDTGTVNATFLVTLSEASPFDVTFQYATGDMTAAAGRDYTAASGTVTIPAGQTSATVTVAVKGDRLVEPTETFAAYLTAAPGATIIDPLGVGTILDNDVYPLVSISDVTKSEGRRNKTTTFTFTVTLSAPYDERVTLSFQTVNGTATTGDNDYVARSGTLTFFPGETTKTITIEVKGDSKNEANETFYLDLFGLSGNAVLTKNRGIGTILNDD
jgi:hypothetical protein